MEVDRNQTVTDNPEEQEGDQSQEAFEARRASEIEINDLPSPDHKRRRRYTKCYTDEHRAAIARYAVEHGNAAAIRKFQPLYSHTLPESTVRSFKKRYLEELSDKRKSSGDATCDIAGVPSRKRGRKHKGSIERSSICLGEQFEIADMSILDPSGSFTANGSMDPTSLILSPETTRRLQVQPPVEPPTPAPVPIFTATASEQHSSSSSEESSSPHSKQARKVSDMNQMYSILLKILSEVSKKEKESHDEDGLFGLQVAANLRRLSSRQKATAKMRIQQALLEIEFPIET